MPGTVILATAADAEASPITRANIARIAPVLLNQRRGFMRFLLLAGGFYWQSNSDESQMFAGQVVWTVPT